LAHAAGPAAGAPLQAQSVAHDGATVQRASGVLQPRAHPEPALRHRIAAPHPGQEVASAFHVTINDVVLAVCTGALRAYLDERGELPDRALVAGVPVSTHAPGQALRANSVSNIFTVLPVHIADPAAQVHAVHDVTKSAKHLFNLLGTNMLAEWSELTPPLPYTALVRLYGRLRPADRHRPPINLVVSSVPGPRTPLYIAGARLDAIYSMGPILEGVGLNVTVWSYLDALNFGIVATPEHAPALGRLRAQLDHALSDLRRAAATVRGAPTPGWARSGLLGRRREQRLRLLAGRRARPDPVPRLPTPTCVRSAPRFLTDQPAGETGPTGGRRHEGGTMTSHESHDIGDAAVADELRAHHAIMIGDLDLLTAGLLDAAVAGRDAATAKHELEHWIAEVLVPHAEEEEEEEEEEEATSYRACGELTEGRLLIEAMLAEHALIRKTAHGLSTADDPRVAGAYGRVLSTSSTATSARRTTSSCRCWSPRMRSPWPTSWPAPTPTITATPTTTTTDPRAELPAADTHRDPAAARCQPGASNRSRSRVAIGGGVLGGRRDVAGGRQAAGASGDAEGDRRGRGGQPGEDLVRGERGQHERDHHGGDQYAGGAADVQGQDLRRLRERSQPRAGRLHGVPGPVPVHWHRSAGATSPSTSSTWLPQPEKVGRSQVGRCTCLHIPPRGMWRRAGDARRRTDSGKDEGMGTAKVAAVTGSTSSIAWALQAASRRSGPSPLPALSPPITP
jgi:hypothetical protein